MSYYIDIIDTVSPLNRLVQEVASGGGIELSWNGGDKKDKLKIVSSELNFDMLDRLYQDAAFAAYYTGNETRFKVQAKLSSDDSIFWQGFILPDLYREPYKNGNLFVNFTATDGLGRLKGKYLPDDFYSREQSLIDIFCALLQLTGLQLDLYFLPAIENFKVKDWKLIYIDTATFIDGSKKKDAYSILEMQLKDAVCVCYQADNRWYIEGINRRHVRKVSYKSYDYMGNFLGTVVYDRLVKEITPLVTPYIDIIPAYNEITVTHKRTAPGLPKTASKSVNVGWASATGVVGEIYPNDWMGHNGYYGRCKVPDYCTTVFNQYYFDGDGSTTFPQDDTKYISLAQKLYFDDKEKIKIALTFDIVHPNGVTGSVSSWNNVMKYEVLYNDVVLYSNFGGTVEDRENLIFNSGGTCAIEIEHVTDGEGLLDIKLYRPIGKASVNGVLGVKLSAAEVSIINFQEDRIETDLINDDFTVDVDVDLDYADDKTGASKAFRLAKLKEGTSIYNEIEVFILYGFVFEGKNYSVVQLDGLRLIDNNRYTVYYSGVQVVILDLVYNFNGGEQMVVQTIDLYDTGSFFVKKYGIDDVVESRTHWGEWTDAFYKIENNSYAKTVANIYRRMFNTAHEKMELTAKNAIKFNDIIPFKWVFLKDFHVLNATWNLDNNETNLVLGRSNYKEIGTTNPDDTNIPPIVEAGNTIYIADGVTTASLLATAYDPDGTIEAQEWTQTEGTPAAVMSNPNSLSNDLSGLTGDYYVFQIQVTDDKGATAVDTIQIIREKVYTISLESVEYVSNDRDPRLKREKFKVIVTPELLPGYTISLSGQFHLYARGGMTMLPVGNPMFNGVNKMIQAVSWYNVQKNGVLIEGKSIASGTPWDSDVKEENVPSLFNYVAGDQIYVTLYVEKTKYRYDNSNKFLSLSNYKLQTASIAIGYGTVSGLPVEEQLTITKDE